MKKFFSVFALLFVCCFCLVGCGVSGNTSIAAINFSRQIFYVDENCTKNLDYKVFPSTANNFDILYSQSHQDFYTLIGGNFTAQEGFNSVQITVQAGDITDSCYVVRKIYPTSTYLTHPSLNGQGISNPNIVLSAGSSTNLQMFGEFNSYFNTQTNRIEQYSTPSTQIVSNEIFNFDLESSDPTVVEVVDSETMQIKATGKTGTATITAYLVDDNGFRKTGSNMRASIDVSVVNPVSSIKVLYGDKFVENSTGSALTFGSENTNSVTISLFLIDNQNNFIENEVALRNISVSTLGNNKLTISNASVSSVGGVRCLQFTLGLQNMNSGDQTTIYDKILITCNYLQDENFNQVTHLLTLS